MMIIFYHQFCFLFFYQHYCCQDLVWWEFLFHHLIEEHFSLWFLINRRKSCKHIPWHVTQKDEKLYLSNFTETKRISLIRSVLGNVGTWHANYINFQLSEDSCWLIQCWLFSATWLWLLVKTQKKKKKEEDGREGKNCRNSLSFRQTFLWLPAIS